MSLLTQYLWPHTQRQLLRQFVMRDLQNRFRQSWLGVLWLILIPLLTLAVYTLVFRFIFESRWGGEASTMAFAFRLFIGLALFSFVSDCLLRAPRLISEQPNLVKKVVFPLPILIWTQAIVALVQFSFALLLLFIGLWLESGNAPWLIFAMPLIMIPLLYLVLGLSWILAALGVYIRDTQQIIGLLISLLLFLSPIFYPSTALPSAWQFWMQFNLFAYWIELARQLIFEQQWPALGSYLIMCLLSIVIALAGATLFEKTREGFADVL
jgi:lipopolysaccharide transport system permease protein